VLFQVFNVFNARSERLSTFSANFFSNRTLWFAVCMVALLQILVVQWKAAEDVFRTVPLTLTFRRAGQVTVNADVTAPGTP
jgi:Ca2+-transporting ATPase